MPDRPTTEPTLQRAQLGRSLAHIVRRLRIRRAISEGAAAACCIVGASLLYQLALATIASAPAVDALRWVLIGGVVVALVWFGVRLARPVTLGDAAAAADRAADLKDELKSACWLTGEESASRPFHAGEDENRGSREFIALLVQRANASAQRIDARQVVPVKAPRGLAVAFVMASITAALAWWSPRWTHPVATVAEKVMQSLQAVRPSTRAEQTAEARAAKNPPAAG